VIAACFFFRTIGKLWAVLAVDGWSELIKTVSVWVVESDVDVEGNILWAVGADGGSSISWSFSSGYTFFYCK